MSKLGLNIDHVATVRQARYRGVTHGLAPEPSLYTAAQYAIKAGAHGITVHLREDRRHAQDSDVIALRRLKTNLNMEMAVTPEMVRLALKYKPDEVCLVPENRAEVTTEGGLDVKGNFKRIAAATTKLREHGIAVSAFITPDLDQVRASADAGTNYIELHTGAYANTETARSRAAEIKRHVNAFDLAVSLGLRVNAGHGLHYTNVKEYLRAVPEIDVLNIGHSVISRAIYVGLDKAVREMLALIQ
jgi:pyridoxine 5-phosphate synthase